MYVRGTRWLSVMALLALAGCAGTAPSIPQTDVWVSGSFATADVGQDAPMDLSAWRMAWKDPTLNRLLERAADANLDGRLAWERVQEARAGLQQLRSRSFPTVDVQGSASDERTGLPAAIKQGNPDTRAYRLGVDLGWEIDLWGGINAAAEAGAYDAWAAEGGWVAARWTAQHEVARHYLIWQGARLRTDLLEQLLRTDQEVERITERRRKEGVVSVIEQAARLADVREIEAQLAPLRTLQKVTEHHLAMLVGARPGVPLPELTTVAAALPAVTDLPVGVPIDLLKRRPDLWVAERQLMAETQRLRVADADLWPKLFLGVALGSQDLRLNGLNLSPSRFSNLALAFTLPLFNAGRLQAAVDQQSARQRAATLSYERAVLQALSDVENALVSQVSQRDIEAKRREVVDARVDARRRADRLHQEGQIDPLDRLALHRAELGARLAHTEARLGLALGTLRLYQALGGGWPDPATPAQASSPLVSHRSNQGKP